MSPAVSSVLRTLGGRGLRRAGSGWTAKCPGHEDQRASLSVGEGEDGRVLLHCHAGCETEAIVEALGLTTSNLFSGDAPPTRERTRPTNGSQRARIAATYDYRDEAGALLYQVVRFEPKDFRQRRPEGRGWTWNLGDVRRVLYKLPEVLAAAADAVVYVVEGEKDADALATLGFIATTSAGGAGKWRPEYGEALRGRRVVILPDNDEPGQKHAAQVAAALAGVAASALVLALDGLPDKGDVSDWLAAGGTVRRLLEIVDSAQAAAAPPVDERGPPSDDVPPHVGEDDPGEIDAQAETPPWASQGARVVALAPGGWSEPEELPNGLPEVPAFDDRLLPEALRPWLSDAADRTQCPPEYAAVGAMVALGSVVGRGCTIRPKRHDDWTVVPNLWGAVVGPPSSMKSPALTEALRPVNRLAAEAAKAHQGQVEGHAAALAEAKARRAVIEGQMKKAAKGDGDMQALRAEFTAAADPAEPTERRYVVNDATVEKLGELLNENPRGLLHYRDELTGWLATLDRSGHENDRAFFLEAWTGLGRYTYDRIGRGTLHIEAACVSMLGGIQPGPLAQYLRGAVGGGAGDDGLMQRFQVLVYPDAPKTWRNVDRWPDTAARNRALDVFRRIDALTPETLGAAVDDDTLPILHFDGEAQELFNGWRDGLMSRLRSGEEHPAIEAHLAKYPSLLPSLALICHLADAPELPPGPVSIISAQRAAAWCDLLEAHARRVYRSVTAEELAAARQIIARLRSGKITAPFATWEVLRPQWAGLTQREVVEKAVAILVDHGWLRSAVVATGGRPRTEYHAHPSLRAREAA